MMAGIRRYMNHYIYVVTILLDVVERYESLRKMNFLTTDEITSAIIALCRKLIMIVQSTADTPPAYIFHTGGNPRHGLLRLKKKIRDYCSSSACPKNTEGCRRSSV
jgi:hypothetical protein